MNKKDEYIQTDGEIVEVFNETNGDTTSLTSIEVIDGIEQIVINGSQREHESTLMSDRSDEEKTPLNNPINLHVSCENPINSKLVVTEHTLDSMAPAYSEEDEILAGGWKKRVVVITGATEGIGYETAVRFSLYADIVYNLGLHKQEDDTINFIKTDITKPEEIAIAFEKIYAKEGQIDVLINNAGIGFSGAAESTTPEIIASLINTNFMGTVNACACAIPYMREQGRGRIINFSSLAAKFPLPFQSYFGASQAAVRNYTFAMREEVKHFGIKISCVMFSEVATNFTEHKLRNKHDNKAYKYRLAKSIAQYEYAEQQGKDPSWIAKKLFKLSNTKNPPPQVIFGVMDKIRVFTRRFLSIKMIMRLISRKY